MSYNNYVIGKPDGTTGSGASFAAELLTNLNALMDAVVLGTMQGWNFSVTIGTGTAEQPQFFEYSRDIFRLRKEITWSVDGDVTQVIYAFNGASGVGAYDVIGTLTYTYDGSYNLISSTWS